MYSFIVKQEYGDYPKCGCKIAQILLRKWVRDDYCNFKFFTAMVKTG